MAAAYPQEVAVATYTGGDVNAVAAQLNFMAGAFPGRAREFAWQAARDIAVVYCEHGDITVPPLPDFSVNKDAQKAAKTHPGLCAVSTTPSSSPE